MKARGFFALFLAQTVLAVLLGGVSWAKGADCQAWMEIICRDLGCMPAACLNMGGRYVAQGIVQNEDRLKKLGFQFKKGPYKISAERLNPGRYVISLQAMARREDRQTKEVKLKTKADEVFPGRDPGTTVPGKIHWSAAIDHDARTQLGLASRAEIFKKQVEFVNIVILDPDKLVRFGFPRLKKRDTRHQMIYLGDNRWKVTRSANQVGPILVYEKTRWRAEGPAPKPGPQPRPEPAASSQVRETPAPATGGIQAINTSRGVSGPIWKIVALHPGDTIKEEMALPHSLMTMIASNAPIGDIISYYEKKLLKKGWRVGVKHFQGNQGMLIMMKDEKQLIMGADDKAAMKEGAATVYRLVLQAPDL